MDEDIGLRHLRILACLLETGSLTRTAELLGASQPSISKALRRLRGHFGDPLLVRVGLAMQPTPRAGALLAPLRALLGASAALKATSTGFDPAASVREFTCLMTEVGAIHFVPPLMRRLAEAGPGLSLRVLPLDSRPFAAQLESGVADIAIGFLPEAGPALRRQHLYADSCLAVVRPDHPRRESLSSEAFWDERHVMMANAAAGHAAYRRLDRALSERLRPDQVQVRVPSFVAGAFVAKNSDAVATLPARLAQFLAPVLGLASFVPPFDLPPIEIDQLWHERVHHDDGHRWLRATVFRVLGGAR